MWQNKESPRVSMGEKNDLYGYNTGEKRGIDHRRIDPRDMIKPKVINNIIDSLI
jgi:hypothetical protein